MARDFIKIDRSAMNTTGAAITLNPGETLTVDFDGANGLFTVT